MTTSLNTATPKSAQGRWASLRDDLRERREAAAARRVLERELATFTTPADVIDLLAAVDQHDSAEADDIRSILSHNLGAQQRRRGVAA